LIFREITYFLSLHVDSNYYLQDSFKHKNTCSSNWLPDGF